MNKYYLALLLIVSPFYSQAECPKDQYFDLNYPNDLKVGPKSGQSAPYTPFYNRGLYSGENRPESAPPNTGVFWLPKEACGKKEINLLIALHGWRSFKNPKGNVFLKSPEHKHLETYVREHINKGGAPLMIAGPMHDIGPRSNTWFSWDEDKKTGYNINHHIEKMIHLLKENNINLKIKTVSILGHSNANCAKGLFRSATELDKTRYPLHLVLSADGTCGQSVFINDAFFKMIEKEPKAKLFHMWIWHPSDEATSKMIKRRYSGINNDPAVTTSLKPEYNTTWKSLDQKFLTYKLKVKGPSGKHTHSTVPMDILKEVLPRFFKD